MAETGVNVRSETGSRSEQKPVRRRKWLAVLATIVALLCCGSLLLVVFGPRRATSLQLALADGRILQIEGITYGTKHRIGKSSMFFDRLSPWLPAKIRQWSQPKAAESKFELQHPALVVWVNAIDPNTGTNVDCQMIRTEFVDKHEDLFAEDTSSWFGGQKFWRVGHIFYAYPRDERELTFRVIPWRTNQTISVRFPNPNIRQAANWVGQPLPQTNKIAGLEMVLGALTVTNAGKRKWETPAEYWQPIWEIRQDGQPACGWSEPEWTVEDPLGNRAKALGIHQPVLRFSAIVYPEATNIGAAKPLLLLPSVSLAGMNTNEWWRKSCRFESNEIVALGICPPGVHAFCDGDYDTNSPAGLTAVRGGAPSGWVGQIKRVNPLQIKRSEGHYTPSPTIYIRAADWARPERLAVRVRDQQGRVWIAKPETQRSSQGINAFLLQLPADVTNIVPELLILKPIEAQFVVRTPVAK